MATTKSGKGSTNSAVRQIAVENFLGSLGGMTRDDANANLEMDARMYKWNAATVKAIRTGISKHFKK